MAEPQYVVIAGFPNADFMAVALDKDGAAISEKTFKPVDFMREMESFLEAYPAPEIRMIAGKPVCFSRLPRNILPTGAIPVKVIPRYPMTRPLLSSSDNVCNRVLIEATVLMMANPAGRQMNAAIQ